VAAPNTLADALQPLFERSDVQQQVTGHANIILTAFGGAEEKYSNSAIRHADGTFSGEFQLKSAQDGGLAIHGNVICFKIVADRVAWLGGVVEHSNTPLAPPGTEVIWTVIDNGEGANDPPDLTSDFFTSVPVLTQAHCTVGLNLAPFLPVLSGNLQVHP
jgi:hypothetical protein